MTGAGAAFLGTTEVAGGELRVGSPVSVAGLKQTGGLITGTLTVTGQFNWTDGDQAGPGATVLAAGATGPDQRQRRASTRTASCATPAR